MAFWLLHYAVYKHILWDCLTHVGEGITIFQNVARHPTTQCHIPQDSNPQPYRCETLMSSNLKTIILVTTVVRTWKLKQLNILKPSGNFKYYQV
jgi:hypothetical protein